MKKRVLIIDDDPNMRQVAAEIIRKLGWEPLEAKNGSEGVRMSIEEQPDLVVIDFSVTDPIRRETARILKKDPRTAKIPIIAHSIWIL